MVHPKDASSNHSTGLNKMEQRSKKKVEWSGNLSSVESVAPAENRSPNWDSETGHLLSYFLGAEQHQAGGSSSTSPSTRFITTPSSSNGNLQGILHNGRQSNYNNHRGEHTNMDGSQGPTPQPGFAVRTSRSSYDHHHHSEMDEDDNDYAPPPTPATQYYHHSSKPLAGRPPTHSKNYSSTSSSMNSAAVPGFKASMAGNDIVHTSADHTIESTSPLSPTLMLGLGHEPLMLPPSPNESQQQLQSQQSRQSHLEWLQYINSLAKQANTNQTSTQPLPTPNASMTSPQGTMHPAGTQTHPVPSMGYPGVTGLQVAYGHPPMYFTPAAMKILQTQSPPVESEEKKAKRLERNRESARKSRLRKKERLSMLEDQVAGLHDDIEAARTIQINDMNPRLRDFFVQRIVRLDEASQGGTIAIPGDALAAIFRGSGLNCEVQRASIDFQYSKLKRTLMPRYQKFLLWLTLHQESWFTAGKEQFAQREASQQSMRNSSSWKISSKQVGDEITNGPKSSEDETPAGKKKAAKARREKEIQTAEAFDPLRMWPLLCFELSISVDQEERIQHAMKIVRAQTDLQDHRTQIEAATRMTSRLKEAVLLQSHNVGVRAGRAYLDILNPNQSVAFQRWLATNRERCYDSSAKRKYQLFTDQKPVPRVKEDPETMTLSEVCRKLEAVLKISKGEH